MIILETERLVIRQLTIADTDFILALLNEPSFLRYIGDKGVRSDDDARQYILNGPVDSYRRNGFGLYLVQLKETQTSIGICGLIKREALEHVDIGFAFLPEFWNRGFAFESAAAVMNYGRDVLHLDRIVAITDPDNEASINLLHRLGLKFERVVTLSDDRPGVKLFGRDLS